MQLTKRYKSNEIKTYYMSKMKFWLLIVIGIVVLCTVMFISLTNGNYATSFSDVYRALSNPKNNQQIYSIIIYSRMPRLLASLAVGAALSSAGWVYQEVFANKMVSPDLLGVSSGAGVGASVGIILGLGLELISIVAFLTGMAAVCLTMGTTHLFTRHSDKTLSMILSGIVISGLMSSLLGLLKYISNDAQLATITYWLLGGFYNVTYKELVVVLPVIVISLMLLVLFRWKIMLLKNGELDAKAHGVNYIFMRNVAIVLATVMTAASVSISGTIGWIGLAIPNLMRIFVKDNEKQVLPLVIIYGAVFTGISDYFSRSITGTEIPIGILTGIIGAVVFVVAIAVRRYKNG